MSGQGSEYFFRHRENGAAVFRLGPGNRLGQLERQEIAVVNLRNGSVRPHGQAVLSAEDHAAIAEWIIARRAELLAREGEDARRLIDQLNATAQWVQARASDAEIAALSAPLFFALQDLREALVRRRAGQVRTADDQ